MSDALVQELRRLRKGRGLSLARLQDCTALRGLVASNDTQDAYRLVLATVESLGADLAARAVKNAYAIGMKEPGTLTQRRSDFAVINQRHVDTIESYENQMIDEIVARMKSELPEFVEPKEPPSISRTYTVVMNVRVEKRRVVEVRTVDGNEPLFRNRKNHKSDRKEGQKQVIYWATGRATAIETFGVQIRVTFADEDAPRSLKAEFYLSLEDFLVGRLAEIGELPVQRWEAVLDLDLWAGDFIRLSWD